MTLPTKMSVALSQFSQGDGNQSRQEHKKREVPSSLLAKEAWQFDGRKIQYNKNVWNWFMAFEYRGTHWWEFLTQNLRSDYLMYWFGFFQIFCRQTERGVLSWKVYKHYRRTGIEPDLGVLMVYLIISVWKYERMHISKYASGLQI